MDRACEDSMGARHFRELACWQLARELKSEVYAFTDRIPASRDRDFCEDIRASSRSVSSNIAEGFGRQTHREFARFLSIARGSLQETDNHLQDAFDCHYVSASDFARLSDLTRRALVTTTRLQSYLLRTPDRIAPSQRPLSRQRRR
jgi:four helix bundle protein